MAFLFRKVEGVLNLEAILDLCRMWHQHGKSVQCLRSYLSKRVSRLTRLWGRTKMSWTGKCNIMHHKANHKPETGGHVKTCATACCWKNNCVLGTGEKIIELPLKVLCFSLKLYPRNLWTLHAIWAYFMLFLPLSPSTQNCLFQGLRLWMIVPLLWIAIPFVEKLLGDLLSCNHWFVSYTLQLKLALKDVGWRIWHFAMQLSWQLSTFFNMCLTIYLSICYNFKLC